MFSEDDTMRLIKLPPESINGDRSIQTLSAGSQVDLETLNRMHVVETLKQHAGNKARAARALGIGRRSLYRLLERYGLHTTEAVESATKVGADSEHIDQG